MNQLLFVISFSLAPMGMAVPTGSPPGDFLTLQESDDPRAGMDVVSQLFLFPWRENLAQPEETGYPYEKVAFETLRGTELAGLFFDIENSSRKQSSFIVIVKSG